MKQYTYKNYLIGQKTLGKNYRIIAKENNISRTTVQRYLNKFGLTDPKISWSKDEVDILQKFYNKERVKFSDFLKNRSLSSIYHKAHKLHLSRTVKPLKFRIDESFFTNYTKELAYFLGFFMADGNLSLKRRRAIIKLSPKDANILIKLSRCMKSNRPLKYGKDYCALVINDSIILKRLEEFGCVPNDSLSNMIPKDLPDELFFHYLRGYIDGDSSIQICRSKASRQKNVLRVVIYGTKDFLELLRSEFKRLLNLDFNYKIIKSYKYSKRLYRITFNGKNARIICHKLYEESNHLFLERKRSIFEEHLRLL